jgi:hypothetical protein
MSWLLTSTVCMRARVRAYVRACVCVCIYIYIYIYIDIYRIHAQIKQIAFSVE